MSAHRDLLAGGLGMIVGHQADAVTYTPVGGSSGSVNAVVGAEEIVVVELEDGSRIRRRQRLLLVEVGAGAGKVASPHEADTVAIDGNDWSVIEVTATADGWAQLLVSRPERTVAAGRKLPGNR